ncbi:Scr1 family TA system antitoxin-like transcriptional regulator [Streptomyces decoyicus]|uniref:Scr1 family TA system antitoxin-like transcriptional regulator n=1 Tax=Streptomyces decoyicus TaxID=249567 RepID=UPI00362D5C24
MRLKVAPIGSTLVHIAAVEVCTVTGDEEEICPSGAYSTKPRHTALRRTMGGPTVPTEQLDRLLALHHRLPHVQDQVLPFAAGAHPAMGGGHTIFRCDADGPVVVGGEPMTTSLCLEEDAE